MSLVAAPPRATRRSTPPRPIERRGPRQLPDSIRNAELWAHVRLDATLPLGVAHWMNKEFPTPEAREAFVSAAIVMAAEAAKKLGSRKGGAA